MKPLQCALCYAGARKTLSRRIMITTEQPHRRQTPPMTKHTEPDGTPAPNDATLREQLVTALTQYPLPHHALSRLMYVLTRARFKPWKNWQLRWFVKRYGVDMSIAREERLEAYDSFNAFFTRELKPTARPIAAGANTIISPVDGAISQLGRIDDGALFQAKGHQYDLVRLLGGNTERAAPFRNGQFATLYLSPRDYHRIHMPWRGTLEEMVYVPGRLFSVNPRTTRTVPELFARNERVVALFRTDHGPIAMILVGAMFVANIETVWAGTVAPRSLRETLVWNYRGEPAENVVTLDKGQEMGRFNMGSTVILLFGPKVMTWNKDLGAGTPVQMGQAVGEFV